MSNKASNSLTFKRVSFHLLNGKKSFSTVVTLELRTQQKWAPPKQPTPSSEKHSSQN